MIYISGKITGTHDYVERFEKAEQKYSEFGDVVNPVKLCAGLPKNLTHEQYMKIDLAALDLCDKIVMLQGWRSSKGARLEYKFAEMHGLEIILELSQAEVPAETCNCAITQNGEKVSGEKEY